MFIILSFLAGNISLFLYNSVEYKMEESNLINLIVITYLECDQWDLIKYIHTYIHKKLNVTFMVWLKWNLTLCSFCRLTSWGNHWGQRSKLWETESGHQWVRSPERHLRRDLTATLLRSFYMIHYLCFGLVKYFHFLFLSSSVAFSRTSPPSVRAEEGVTMPLCLFCFVFSTSSSSSSSLLQPLFLGVVNLKEP